MKALPASYFKDIKLPPPAQQPADALHPPPPPPALQPAIPAGEAIVPGPEESAEQGPAAADAEAAPAAPYLIHLHSQEGGGSSHSVCPTLLHK